ncbi:MAG TPA: RuBisCO large subunit C-terminal-like domain-containing protein [Conexibacter sp.]|nr:RuBisCO large subunit C-terminal-like domain-containing protein [Conexibacter sp.]
MSGGTVLPDAERDARVVSPAATTARYRIAAPTPLDTAVRALAATVGLGPDAPATVQELTPAPAPAAGIEAAEVTLALPEERLEGGVLALAEAVLDAPFDLPGLAGLRLLDVVPGAGVAAQAPGPAFGIPGTRELAGVPERPILGSIVKPSVGLSIEETAERVRLLGVAGLDFIKDDELLADQAHAPLAARAEGVGAAIDEVERETGRRPMFAFNVSADDVDRMLESHDRVVEAGGTCVMVSLNQVGLAGALALRRHTRVPIHGHRNGWGFLARSPDWGIAYPAYLALWRLVGVDHMHVNGFANKFWEPDESVAASLRACLAPMGDVPRAMPVVSSGQWGGQSVTQYAAVPSLDFMYLAGGGIQGHPDGPEAGVRAITAAWEAATAGVPLEEKAAAVPELRRSLERFGKRRAG